MNMAAPAHVIPVSEHIVQSATLLADPHPDRLFIDVRLGHPSEEAERFREAHIHGAVYGQIRTAFAGTPSAASGNLPLPPLPDLARQMAAWGAGPQTQVIVYGPSPALAARGWWTLKWAGYDDVRLLDGGLGGWEMAGGPVAQGEAPPRSLGRTAPLELTGGHLPAISVEELEDIAAGIRIVDARDEAAFLAGCMPGAVNLPASDQWTPGRLMRTGAEIRAIFGSVGIGPGTEVAVYCGGGVLSALVFMTLAGIGAEPRLFVGSWSQWSKCSARMARTAPYIRELALDENHPARGARTP